MASASQIRREMKQERRALPAQQRHAMGQRLCAHILRSHLYRNAHTIAAYFPFAGEPDLRPLMTQALRDGKTPLLPTVPDNESRMRFRPWHPTTEMRENRFGIAEPVDKRGECSAQSLDLVLTPLLAFDASGNRLGMGAGFYDRTFAFRRHRQAWLAPRLIGTAWSFQQQPRLEAMPWDVPLDGVVTESGWILPE